MRKSQILVVALLIQVSALFSVAAKACPLGAKEDHLTIQRVMMNFGKFVGQADHIALLGAKYPNETVTDADIADAINKLALAQTCAQAVIDKPEGDLLPSKVTFLDGDAKKEYIDDFVYFMTEFRDELIVYQDTFKTLAAAKAADRKWDDVYAESEKINKLIDHAHSKTSQDPSAKLVLRSHNFSMSVGNLKQNMKQIEKNLKAIAAALNDASQNQNSAALAEQTAELFQTAQSQVPEAVSDLPSSQQQAAMQGYQQEIQKGIDLCSQLQNALLNNDSATAMQVLKALSNLKEEGHDQYNP